MRNRARWGLIQCVMVLVGTGRLPMAAGIGAVEPAPPALRLPGTIQPIHYQAELTIEPSAETFAGTLDIDLLFGEKTSLLWLNATVLTIREASIASNGERIRVRPVPGGEDFVGFAFERPVAAGPATLHVAYTGLLNKNETNGLFRQQENGDWYAFSQFEATDARKAFPCFDEPSYKTPWQVTLHVSRQNVAVSNTPVVSEIDEGDGMKTVRFAETKPLPSYLVAIGVGPFDVVDAGRSGMKNTPVRIITPKGKSADARYAAVTTPAVLAQLEQYFRIPFPYEKLDCLAIPETVGFGAMENAGLITYRVPLILAKPQDQTISFERAYANVCVHEVAHQWFGDYVTMNWWDDVWLNESFATWMTPKIIDQWKPEWGSRVDKVVSRSGAMGNDTLVTARKIRQPIETRHDIANAFDGISYGKGAAVLAMFEAWMGEERFRDGVQRYLTAHAFGNASADDFLAAMSAEGGKEIGPAISTFLEQPGVPLVTVDLKASSDSVPTLFLTQRRFLPVGSTGSAKQTWHIPIRVRYRAAGAERQSRLLMTTEAAEIPLSPGAEPDWILANEGESGYYRVLYKSGSLDRLLKDGGAVMSIAERVGVVGDVAALVETGDVSMRDALNLAVLLATDNNRHIIERTLRIAASIDAHLVPDELRQNYSRFIRQVFGERARALGFTPSPGEDDETRLLRSRIIGLVAEEGEDPVLAAEAAKLARLWLKDRSAVNSDLVSTVLRVAARHGDRALFDLLHAEAAKSHDRRERGRLLSALGSFRDEAIERAALDIVLSGELDIREADIIFWSGLDNPKSREMVYEFVKKNFDALAAKLPRDAVADMPFVGSSFCDKAHAADLESFFRDRVEKLAGGPRTLAQALEIIALCTAFKEAQQPSVIEFLGQYR